jgi:hypothetical protein
MSVRNLQELRNKATKTAYRKLRAGGAHGRRRSMSTVCGTCRFIEFIHEKLREGSPPRSRSGACTGLARGDRKSHCRFLSPSVPLSLPLPASLPPSRSFSLPPCPPPSLAQQAPSCMSTRFSHLNPYKTRRCPTQIVM